MKKEQILRWVIYVGAALLLLTPLIVSSSMYFPYITGKAFFFRVVAILIFGTWIILAFYDPKVRPKFSWAAAALWALLAVAFLSAVFGVNFKDSIWSNFERMMGVMTLLHMVLAFVAVAHTLGPKDWRRIFYFSFGISIIVAFTSFAEVGDVARVDANLGNPIYLATYALFHMLMAGYFMLGRIKERLSENSSVWSDWRLYVFGVVGVLNLLALIYTQTRGAALGLMIGLFIAGVLVAVFEKRRVWLKRTAVVGVVLAIAVAGSVFVFSDSSVVQNTPLLNRFANISLEEGNAGARLDTWALGLEGYTERPVLGWGVGNFNYVFDKYYDPAMFDDPEWFDRAHNVVLEWLIGAGPLGALAYLSIFGAAIYLIWRDPEDEEAYKFSVLEKSLLTGLVVAYLVQNLTVFDHLVSYVILAIFLGWLHSRSARPIGWFQKKRLSEAAAAWLSTGVGLAVLTLAVLWNYPGYMQANTLIDAMQQSSQDPQQSLSTFQEAIEYDAMGNQEVREQLVQAAVKVRGSELASSTKAEYFEAANREMQKEINEEPKDIRHYIFHGRLLLSYGQVDQAIERLERANEMSGERKQTILFQLAQAYDMDGQSEAALKAYRKAYELDTSFDEPALRYAAYAIESRQTELGEGVLEDHFGTTTVSNELLLEAYQASDNYEAMIPILKDRLANNPNNQQAYINLAVAYTEAGQNEMAVEVLNKAKQRFPQIANQIEQVIQRIEAGQSVRP